MSRKISNYENFARSSPDHNLRRYTVERTESSISNVSSKIENGHFFDSFLSVLKWITAVFLFSIVLFCAVTSKISLLVLGQQFKTFNQTKTSIANEVSAETSKQALILMLILILMTPQAVSFVYATWTSLRRKSYPWPAKQGFFLILIGGFLETISLCYITIVGLTVLPVTPSAIVLLMCSLAVVPAIWQAIKSKSHWNTTSGKLHVFKFATSAVIAVLGVALLSWKIPDMSAQIGMPIAFILLSIAWTPKLRKNQIKSKHESSNRFHETGARSYVSDFSGYNNDIEQGVCERPPVKRRTACGKAAIISSLLKLILTPIAAVTFTKVYSIADLDNISVGLRAINVSNPSFVYFMLHVFASFFGYLVGWLACALCMQRIGYALPLTLATPIALFLTHVTGICGTDALPLPCKTEEQAYILAAGTLLWLAQFFSTTYYVWKGKGMIMAKAHDLFWIPDYNGICLEQYLLLNRRNEASDEEHVTQQDLSRDIKVFICTTMYHEEDYEMEQLLRSIHDVDMNTGKTERQFESHVFFDGCVRVEVLNSYALQLASLVERTLKVHLSECTKMKTPYGMQLKWRLPGGMDFTIHLKDNAKVKNKKRWSQVMYMSYILDYKQRLLGVKDEQSFILTTDADVKFTHESVEALIDQIIEDPRIGAVCARTHPLGNGPVVWYQIFDYAVGHWFQKVANHMLGSVLCSPGCFSLYRCQAVREVLPTYATNVDHAFEFLTKDMGEDRWMCTLMIQRGWRLTYCAAAEDSTYCPESFDELYKQRRRWTPSTLANLVLLVSEWKRILKNNEHISFLFILYQTFLVCSTVIGPSTVILIIVGGMMFSGLAVSEISTVILISLVVVAYTVVCLFTSQNFQLKVSKLLTFVFAVIMCIVFIGVAVQISNELKERPAATTATPTLGPNTTTSATAPKSLEQHLPAGVSTLYLAGLSGIFIVAALLHPNEFTCLLHGIWYLLCLPSGYLLLTIYSLCNLTDRSWGTREEKSASEAEDWYKPIANLFKKICRCCQGYQTREESDQWKHAANQAKRGSIVESRTSIKTEVTNSSSKITESDETGNKEMTSCTAKGEIFIKTETTEVLHLPTEENRVSHNFEATRPEIDSTKSPLDNAFGGSSQQTGGDAYDDANENYQFPTIVVHSAQEIPAKSQAALSGKTGSKEAGKYSTREITAENSSNSLLREVSPGESIAGPYGHSLSLQKVNVEEEVKQEDTLPSFCEMDFTNTSTNTSFKQEHEHETPRYPTGTSKGNLFSVTTTTLADSIRCTSGDADDVHDCKIIHGPSSICNETDKVRSNGNQSIGFENEVFLSTRGAEGRCSSQQGASGKEIPSNTSSARDGSETLPVTDETMGQKRYVSQPINNGKMPKQKENRKSLAPLTVSRLITSSSSMFEENTNQPERGETHLMTNTELSFKFGSNLSLRALDENGRPKTALKNEISHSDLTLPVEEWLIRDLKRYASNFREHGYDTAGFLPGMTDKDLQLIGIHTRGHRQRLIRDIRKIPRVDIEDDIPENVQDWLEEHGLGEYWPKFESSGYTEPNDLEDLKNMSKDGLKETFSIHKPGHFNRLLSAIRKLQYPNQGQIKLRHTRRELDRLPLLYLDVDNQDDGIEYEFWEGLRQTCLVPELSAFDQTSKLKEKLVELRNTTLLVFGVSNALWMIIILTLVQHKDLKVFGVDIIGLGFLIIYGFIIILQFLSLLVHRFRTFVHILARTAWIPSKKIGNNRVSSIEPKSSHPARSP